MMKPFTKRTFTLSLLVRSLGATLLSLPLLLLAYLKPATSRALREKVMIGVTSVNDCRYCSWVHTGVALANGVDLDELQHVLDSGTFGTVNDREATAILFGKHYADTVRQPSQEARAALATQFTAYERAEIMAYIHFIYYSNLSGNSTDAWVARLSGRKVVDGHPIPEAIAALVAGPGLFLAALLSRVVRPEAMKPLDAVASTAAPVASKRASPMVDQPKDGKVRIEIWSDLMCPFCYIAKRNLEAALDRFPERDRVTVSWKSFLLDADVKSDPSKNAVTYTAEKKRLPEFIARKALSEIEKKAKGSGLNFDLGKAVVANTFNAHRLAHYATTQGKGNEMEEALFHAYFVAGTNIDDQAALVQMGTSIGLPEQELKEVLSSGKFADEVRHDIEEATQIGIRGVPYFLFNRAQPVTGLRGTAVYLEALQKALAEAQAAACAADEELTGAVCDLQGNCRQ